MSVFGNIMSSIFGGAAAAEPVAAQPLAHGRTCADGTAKCWFGGAAEAGGCRRYHG